MKRKLLFAITCIAFVGGVKAQNVGISDVSFTPNAQAILDLSADRKGFLIPRVTLNSATDPINGSKPEGLMVFNQGGSIGDNGFYYWTGAAWTSISTTNGTIAGSGTLNYVPKFTPDGTTIGNSQIFDNGTGIGINTTSPATNLNIYNGAESGTQTNFTQSLANGGILVTSDYTDATYVPGMFWNTQNNNPTLPKAGIYLYQSSLGSKMILSTTTTFSSGLDNNGLVIDDLGNIGIGALSPVESLELYRNGSNPVMLFHSAGVASFKQGLDGSTYKLAAMDNGYGGHTGNFASNDAQILSMTSVGNVGVGNVAPAHKLSVGETTGDGQAVTIRGYSNSPASWKGGGAFGYSSAGVIMGQLDGVAQIGGHNGPLTAWANLAINSGGGNVGVGTTGPVMKLQVNGSGESGIGVSTTGWATLRMDGSDSKSLFIHYGGDGTNDLRFARAPNGLSGWEANVVRFDLDAPDGSFVISNAGGLSSVSLAGSGTRMVTADPSGNIATQALPGGVLPAGSASQTLYHNGTSWVNTSNLSNDGGTINLGSFDNNDSDQWPLVTWRRDVGNSWDEGLIKGSSARGPWGRAGFGIHMHSARHFGFFSSGWDPLFDIEGGTGRAYIKGNTGIGTTNPASKLHVNSTGSGGLNLSDDGWASIRMNGADNKDLWIHYGAGGTNEIRFARTADNFGGWEANVVRFDLDAPGESMILDGAGTLGLATLAGTGNRMVQANASGQLVISNDLPAGDADYIQNQYSSAQSANYWISGEARAKVFNFGHDNQVGSSPGFVDGQFYRRDGQAEMAIDDWFFIRDNDGNVRLQFSSDLGQTVYGPNPGWGRYLRVGGNANQTDEANIAATDGNLHIDSRSGHALYLQYYTGNNTFINGNGGFTAIGHTGPANTLHVNRNSTDNRATVQISNTGNNSWGQTLLIRTTNVGTDGAKILFRSRDTKNWSVGGNNGTDNAFVITEDGGDGVYGTGFGTTRLYIQPGGNVGINSTAPGYKLDVGGTFRSQGWAMFGTGTDRLSLELQSTFHRMAFNELRFYDWNAGGDMVTFNNGNVGLSTTGPASKLHLALGSGDGILMGNYNDQLGYNGSGALPYYAIRFAGYRDVVSNFTGAMISGVRYNLCCSGLSQAMDLSFFIQPNTATVSGDGNLYERFRVSGSGVYATNYYTLSDKRLKSNVRDIEYGLDKVMQMNPVSYTQMMPKSFKADEASKTDEERESFGFIAQELYEIVPDLVNKPELGNGDPNAYWTVSYGKITPILVKAIQEQQKQIEEGEKEREELREQIEQLKEALKRIEALEEQMKR